MMGSKLRKDMESRSVQNLIHQYNLGKHENPDFTKEFIRRIIHELAAAKNEASGFKARLKGQEEKGQNLKKILKQRIQARRFLDPAAKCSLCDHIDDVWDQHG